MRDPDNISRATTVSRPAPVDARERAAKGQALPAPFGDRAAFLRGFLQHPGRVGSVIPSSARLEQKLVRCTRAADAAVVVELGPGTGGTTRALLAAMPATARLLAIELEPAFHARLNAGIRDPRLTVHLGNAEQLGQALAAYGLPPPDVVVSGIPFSTLSPATADRIAASITSALAPGGRFVAYQVRAHVARYATPYLGAPQRSWEWFNIPPLRVFTWTRSTWVGAG